MDSGEGYPFPCGNIIQQTFFVNKTVGEHIRDLESRRQRLHEESMKEGLNHSRLNEIESEIRAITVAISHFLAGIEAEQKIKIG